jgi:hydrogenase maturation protease
MSASPGVLVIGFGNPLRGDDGAGPVVAARCREAGPGVAVVVAHQLLPEMAEQIAAARLVIFVDARAGLAAGDIIVEKIEQPAPAPPLIHHFDPRALLSMAGSLYGHAPRAVLVGIGAASFDCGEELSKEVAQAASRAVAIVRELCVAAP